MSDSFFADLQLPAPDAHLGVGAGSHAQQTAAVMQRFEPVLLDTRPDWVVVVGDVNSTLACALVAVKLRHEIGCRIAHVEAGLRSGDWRMPEEVNRVLTDRCADLLLTPSVDAEANLIGEGIHPGAIVFVGNVMIDSLVQQLPIARTRDLPGRLGVAQGKYAVVTLHRPSNVDDAEALTEILAGLDALAARLPVVFPVHPRTAANIDRFGLTACAARITMTQPLSYLDMLSLVAGAGVVLTDSGGLQEETTVLNVPCVTLREQTERPVTIQSGSNRLIQWPITARSIFDTALAALRAGGTGRTPEGWDGLAAQRIVNALENRLDEQPRALLQVSA